MDQSSRELLAAYTGDAITVYQAFPPEIAEAAIAAGTLVSPFRLERTTWIKPSFFWMMYRSDWGRRDRQERILAIDLSRTALEWILGRSCLTAYEPRQHASWQEWKQSISTADAIIQWDPDRGIQLNKLERRTIQIGLKQQVVRRYVNEWILRVTDVTPLADRIRATVAQGQLLEAAELAPSESRYPLAPDLARKIGLLPAIARSE